MCVNTPEHIPRLLVEGDEGLALTPLTVVVHEPIGLYPMVEGELSAHDVDVLLGEEKLWADIGSVALKEAGARATRLQVSLRTFQIIFKIKEMD